MGNQSGNPAPPSPDPNLGPGGFHEQSLSGKGAKSYLWAGRITHVDCETMVCSVRYDTGTGEHHDVPIPASAGAGPRSWAGTIPEVGSKVILAWSQYSNRIFKPHIVQFLTSGVFPAREYEPFSSVDPDTAKSVLDILPELEDEPGIFMRPIRLKLRKAYPGDFLATSSGGADFILNRDVLLTNCAGNEFVLRSSDQTACLQTINTFESNSAGYYQRGLIKRNAFNLLPDLGFDEETNTFDRKKNPDAFDKLVDFGIINPDGTKNVPEGADDFYPYDTMSDGIRVSFIHHGETDQPFSGELRAEDCYVEDRVELRHTHSGAMDVTSNGDGFQMEKFVPFIEDVRGTVVGNNPYTSDGRSLYKRIMGMSLFDQASVDWSPSIKPKFFAVDQLLRGTEDADCKALGRLFRMKCPRNNNQFVFGVTKEGRVYLHIPASTGNTPDEKGKSLDMFTAGKIRAAIGLDPSDSVSLDVALAGGLKATIGRSIINDNGNPKSGPSIDLKLAGPVKVVYTGNNETGIASEVTVGGSSIESTSGNKFISVNGSSSELIGGGKTIESERFTCNAGTGGINTKSLGNVAETYLQKKDYKIGLLQTELYGVGRAATHLAGSCSDTMLAGSIARTVVAGGMTDTVTSGNYSQTVGVGNMSVSVGTGNMSVAVGAGNLSLATGAGAATLSSTAVTTIFAGGSAQIVAPVIKLGATPGPSGIGNAVAGVPGPPAIHLDYLTGLPLRGMPTIFLGP